MTAPSIRTDNRRPLWLGGILLCVLVSFTANDAVAQNCSSPPTGFGSSWWSAYASWCSACGGRPNLSTTSCTPGPNWGRGGRTRYVPPAIDYEAIRRAREAAERRLKLEADLKEAQEEVLGRLQAARQKFLKDQRHDSSSLKGAAAGTLEIKSGTTVLTNWCTANPKSDECKNWKETKPSSSSGQLVLKGASDELQVRSISNQWKQLHCGMWITGFAIPAARRGDVDEVRFLGSQALMAFSGGPAELQCPQPPAPPDIQGAWVTGPDTPIARFHQALLRVAVKQAERLNRAEKKIEKAKSEKRALGKRKKEKENEVARRDEELKRAEALAKPQEPAEAETGDTAKDDEKEGPTSSFSVMGALRKARAAHKAAQAELDKVRGEEQKLANELTSAEQDKTNANATLGEYEKMFDGVRTDPNKATEILAKIGK